MNNITNIVTELSESNNITTDAKSDLKSVMSVIWIKVLTMIHEVNLITQSRNAILNLNCNIQVMLQLTLKVKCFYLEEFLMRNSRWLLWY